MWVNWRTFLKFISKTLKSILIRINSAILCKWWTGDLIFMHKDWRLLLSVFFRIFIRTHSPNSMLMPMLTWLLFTICTRVWAEISPYGFMVFWPKRKTLTTTLKTVHTISGWTSLSAKWRTLKPTLRKTALFYAKAHRLAMNFWSAELSTPQCTWTSPCDLNWRMTTTLAHTQKLRRTTNWRLLMPRFNLIINPKTCLLYSSTSSNSTIRSRLKPLSNSSTE